MIYNSDNQKFNRNKVINFILSLMLMVLLLPFQNCEFIRSYSTKSASLYSSQLESGHGDGYGGMISLYLYRPTNCPIRLSYDKIDVYKGSIVVSKLDSGTCTHKITKQDKSALALPILTNEFGIFHDEIYGSYINSQTQSVDKVIEYYCYWQSDDSQRKEIVVRRNIREYTGSRESIVWNGNHVNKNWSVNRNSYSNIARELLDGSIMQYIGTEFQLQISLNERNVDGYYKSNLRLGDSLYPSYCLQNGSDLVIEINTPENAIAGESVDNLNWTVKNIGKSTSERFQVEYMFSYKSFNSFDPLIKGRTTFGGSSGIGGLPAGESYTSEYTDPLQPGLWETEVCIIPDYYSQEEGILNDRTSEDNCAFKTFEVFK